MLVSATLTPSVPSVTVISGRVTDGVRRASITPLRILGDEFGRFGLVECKSECVQGKPLVDIRKCEAS